MRTRAGLLIGTYGLTMLMATRASADPVTVNFLMHVTYGSLPILTCHPSCVVSPCTAATLSLAPSPTTRRGSPRPCKRRGHRSERSGGLRPEPARSLVVRACNSRFRPERHHTVLRGVRVRSDRARAVVVFPITTVPRYRRTPCRLVRC